jgi:hypothetical protein
MDDLSALKTELEASLSELFAHGALNELEFGRLAKLVEEARDEASLSFVLGELRALVPLPARSASRQAAPAQRSRRIDIIMPRGELKLKDRWLRGDHYLFDLTKVEARIDLRDYETEKGMDLLFEFDCQSSEVYLILPYSFALDEGIEPSGNSDFAVRRGDRAFGRNVMRTRGQIERCDFKIKYKD